ncbi:Amphiphysin [Plakobranchus ocellatus]|uniref:Amphiphysin n=1 Tax=Plakobranchus ocellatus TaxID=259542 RepID=A0AAV3Y165_9GAST|nr:Amphiphysin [Plakobranchus ocellatus]
MAESSTKPGIFAKAQKTISRTKTKVLQNLGRAEKTTDDTFTDNVQKIDRQQEVAHHLQKELKNYVHCIKDLCQASKSLQAVLQDTYESGWTEEPVFKSQIQTMDLLWVDFVQNLQDSTMAPLHSYLMSFPVLKNKIAKRGRKLVDYDNARHHLESLQAAKKKDDLKIQKAQDDLKEAKKIYDDLNNELHIELPDFYNSRVSFFAGLFTSFFGAEYTFHTEIGRSNGALGDVAQQLAKDYAAYIYQPKTPLSKSVSTNSDNGLNGDMSGLSVTSPAPSSPSPVASASGASDKDSSQATYTNYSATETGTILQSRLCPKRKAPVAPRALQRIEEEEKAAASSADSTQGCSVRNSLTENSVPGLSQSESDSAGRATAPKTERKTGSFDQMEEANYKSNGLCSRNEIVTGKCDAGKEYMSFSKSFQEKSELNCQSQQISSRQRQTLCDISKINSTIVCNGSEHTWEMFKTSESTSQPPETGNEWAGDSEPSSLSLGFGDEACRVKDAVANVSQQMNAPENRVPDVSAPPPAKQQRDITGEAARVEAYIANMKSSWKDMDWVANAKVPARKPPATELSGELRQAVTPAGLVKQDKTNVSIARSRPQPRRPIPKIQEISLAKAEPTARHSRSNAGQENMTSEVKTAGIPETGQRSGFGNEQNIFATQVSLHEETAHGEMSDIDSTTSKGLDRASYDTSATTASSHPHTTTVDKHLNPDNNGVGSSQREGKTSSNQPKGVETEVFGMPPQLWQYSGQPQLEQCSGQVMPPQEGQCSRQVMPPQEGQCSRQVMPPQEGQCSRQVMPPQAGQCSKQVMSPQKGQCSRQAMPLQQEQCSRQAEAVCDPRSVKNDDGESLTLPFPAASTEDLESRPLLFDDGLSEDEDEVNHHCETDMFGSRNWLQSFRKEKVKEDPNLKERDSVVETQHTERRDLKNDRVSPGGNSKYYCVAFLDVLSSSEDEDKARDFCHRFETHEDFVQAEGQEPVPETKLGKLSKDVQSGVTESTVDAGENFAVFEEMPEPWMDDKMLQGYHAVTVQTKDLSPLEMQVYNRDTVDDTSHSEMQMHNKDTSDDKSHFKPSNDPCTESRDGGTNETNHLTNTRVCVPESSAENQSPAKISHPGLCEGKAESDTRAEQDLCTCDEAEEASSGHDDVAYVEAIATDTWTLQSFVQMLMPKTVQLLASHTKSYIDSCLHAEKPREQDLEEIRKICKDVLTAADAGRQSDEKDSSVDVSCTHNSPTETRGSAETKRGSACFTKSPKSSSLDPQHSLASPEFSLEESIDSLEADSTPVDSDVKCKPPEDELGWRKDNTEHPIPKDVDSDYIFVAEEYNKSVGYFSCGHGGSRSTNQPHPHPPPPVPSSNVPKPIKPQEASPSFPPAQTAAKEIESSDSAVEILEKHFHSVLRDIISKGSSHLKKRRQRISSPALHRTGSGESSETSLNVSLHERILCRLQSSIPVIAKTPVHLSRPDSKMSINSLGEVAPSGAGSWASSKENVHFVSQQATDFTVSEWEENTANDPRSCNERIKQAFGESIENVEPHTVKTPNSLDFNTETVCEESENVDDVYHPAKDTELSDTGVPVEGWEKITASANLVSGSMSRDLSTIAEDSLVRQLEQSLASRRAAFSVQGSDDNLSVPCSPDDSDHCTHASCDTVSDSSALANKYVASSSSSRISFTPASNLLHPPNFQSGKTSGRCGKRVYLGSKSVDFHDCFLSVGDEDSFRQQAAGPCRASSVHEIQSDHVSGNEHLAQKLISCSQDYYVCTSGFQPCVKFSTCAQGESSHQPCIRFSTRAPDESPQVLNKLGSGLHTTDDDFVSFGHCCERHRADDVIENRSNGVDISSKYRAKAVYDPNLTDPLSPDSLNKNAEFQESKNIGEDGEFLKDDPQCIRCELEANDLDLVAYGCSDDAESSPSGMSSAHHSGQGSYQNPSSGVHSQDQGASSFCAIDHQVTQVHENHLQRKRSFDHCTDLARSSKLCQLVLSPTVTIDVRDISEASEETGIPLSCKYGRANFPVNRSYFSSQPGRINIAVFTEMCLYQHMCSACKALTVSADAGKVSTQGWKLLEKRDPLSQGLASDDRQVHETTDNDFGVTRSLKCNDLKNRAKISSEEKVCADGLQFCATENDAHFESEVQGHNIPLPEPMKESISKWSGSMNECELCEECVALPESYDASGNLDGAQHVVSRPDGTLERSNEIPIEIEGDKDSCAKRSSKNALHDISRCNILTANISLVHANEDIPKSASTSPKSAKKCCDEGVFSCSDVAVSQDTEKSVASCVSNSEKCVEDSMNDSSHPDMEKNDSLLPGNRSNAIKILDASNIKSDSKTGIFVEEMTLFDAVAECEGNTKESSDIFVSGSIRDGVQKMFTGSSGFLLPETSLVASGRHKFSVESVDTVEAAAVKPVEDTGHIVQTKLLEEGFEDLVQNLSFLKREKDIPQPKLGSLTAEGEKDIPQSELGSLTAEGEKDIPHSELGSLTAEGEKDIPQSELGSLTAEGEKDIPQPEFGSLTVEGEKDIPHSELGSFTAEGEQDIPQLEVSSPTADGEKNIPQLELGSLIAEGEKDIPQPELGSLTAEGEQDIPQLELSSPTAEGEKDIPQLKLGSLIAEGETDIPQLELGSRTAEGEKDIPQLQLGSPTVEIAGESDAATEENVGLHLEVAKSRGVSGKDNSDLQADNETSIECTDDDNTDSCNAEKYEMSMLPAERGDEGVEADFCEASSSQETQCSSPEILVSVIRLELSSPTAEGEKDIPQLELGSLIAEGESDIPQLELGSRTAEGEKDIPQLQLGSPTVERAGEPDAATEENVGLHLEVAKSRGISGKDNSDLQADNETCEFESDDRVLCLESQMNPYQAHGIEDKVRSNLWRSSLIAQERDCPVLGKDDTDEDFVTCDTCDVNGTGEDDTDTDSYNAEKYFETTMLSAERRNESPETDFCQAIECTDDDNTDSCNAEKYEMSILPAERGDEGVETDFCEARSSQETRCSSPEIVVSVIRVDSESNGEKHSASGYTNGDGDGDEHTTTTAATVPSSTAETGSTNATASDSEDVTNDDAGGTGDGGKAGKNKFDNGDPSSSEYNNLYEEPREPEKQQPTAAKRTDISLSASSKTSDSNENEEESKKEDTKTTEYEDDSQLYSSPPSNRPVISPPPNMMYQVQATHKYTGEDVDELNFDPGEVIYVIPFENPEEQDDGWQMGIKQSDGIKGVFPENFTVRVESS